jgi:hypothetical protein
VDLPEPEGPTRKTNSPLPTWQCEVWRPTTRGRRSCDVLEDDHVSGRSSLRRRRPRADYGRLTGRCNPPPPTRTGRDGVAVRREGPVRASRRSTGGRQPNWCGSSTRAGFLPARLATRSAGRHQRSYLTSSAANGAGCPRLPVGLSPEA